MNGPTQNPWLQAQDIYFLRGDRVILKPTSLDFRNGEMILLTGHNGSGKTTLLRILAGLLKPMRGRFTIEGESQEWRRSRARLRQHICYLHQHPYLFDCSVYDNIAYGLKRQRMPRRMIRERVEEALHLIDLKDLAERNSKELSGGEKQRVAIARAWVLSPRMMLLDEPLSNLDKHSRKKCYSLMHQLQQQHISVIFTSHEPQHGDLRLDRHLHLYQGELSAKPLQTESVTAPHRSALQQSTGQL